MRIFIGIDLGPEVRTRIERFLEGVRGFRARCALGASGVATHYVEVHRRTTDGAGRGHHQAFAPGRKQGVRDSCCRIWILSDRKGSARILDRNSRRTATARTGREHRRGDSRLGVPREDRPYSPHLTLARAGGQKLGSPKWRKGDAPNAIFAVLEKRLAAMGEIDFGTMTANEFILYQSQLFTGGSKYTKLQRFPMKRECSAGILPAVTQARLALGSAGQDARRTAAGTAALHSTALC